MFRQRTHHPGRRAAQAVAPDRADRFYPGLEPIAADPALIAAWLAGRSLARGLPPPEPDRGGLRVDTGSEAETCRWVFTVPDVAITELTREIDRPGYLVKLCEPSAVLAGLLADSWRVESENCVMTAPGGWGANPDLPRGYRSVVRQAGPVTHLRILDGNGLLAASGYAAEVAGAFVYDRILTVAGHRRRGLGRAVMGGLATHRRTTATEILTATVAGRALYENLGGSVYAPWSTASARAPAKAGA